MKLLLLQLTLLGRAYASPITLTEPIPVTGSGNFVWSYPGEASYSLYATGTDGTNTVTLVRNSGLPLAGTFRSATGWLSDTTTIGGCCGGWGLINGIGSGLIRFSVGGGGGYLELYDSGNILLASAQLMSVLTMTDYQEKWSFDHTHVEERSGKMLITGEAPEPTTAQTIALGFIFVGLVAITMGMSKRS